MVLKKNNKGEVMKFKTAKCERTNEEILLSDGYFVANPLTREWSFSSIDAPEHLADYIIPVSSICKSPESLVDWLAHINEKTWFDAANFMNFFTKFRLNNNLFNSL